MPEAGWDTISVKEETKKLAIEEIDMEAKTENQKIRKLAEFWQEEKS